ncbi:hypothetical protein [Devosia sp.]|uniref:hypothetical protein n=1 Tax=Devosia sp. TaxID=1871048 RepID=UPI003BAC3A4B
MVIVTSAGITEASAKGGSKLLPKQSLYNNIDSNASRDEIKALCAEIVARENASPVGMTDASGLYMHGKILGVTCLKVDYYKALVLAHDSGDAFTLKASLTYIRSRASSGVDKAIRALEKYERAYK